MDVAKKKKKDGTISWEDSFPVFSSVDRYWREVGGGRRSRRRLKYLATVRESMFAITCGRSKANTYKLGSAQQAVMTHINPN